MPESRKIVVQIDYDDGLCDQNSRYTATVNDEVYKVVVYGRSITECFEQIATSMDCHDDFIKKQTKGK